MSLISKSGHLISYELGVTNYVIGRVATLAVGSVKRARKERTKKPQAYVDLRLWGKIKDFYNISGLLPLSLIGSLINKIFIVVNRSTGE